VRDANGKPAAVIGSPAAVNARGKKRELDDKYAGERSDEAKELKIESKEVEETDPKRKRGVNDEGDQNRGVNLFSVCGEEVEIEFEGEDYEIAAFDDVTREKLDYEKAAEARRDELEELVWRKVFEIAPWEATGPAPIAVRWIDINKRDVRSPLCRSRLVAGEIRSKYGGDSKGGVICSHAAVRDSELAIHQGCHVLEVQPDQRSQEVYDRRHLQGVSVCACGGGNRGLRRVAT
jgi:hypothetical protein